MQEYINKAMTFAEYIGSIDQLLAEGKTTGPVQSEAMFGYAKLNRQRMARLAKTVTICETLAKSAQALRRPVVWLIITEGWCGDAAQNIPVIEKIAAESNNIETRYVLRDENPDLIDGFLTGGARAIPKLIALDAGTLEVIGTWGARPAKAQAAYEEWKHAGTDKPAMMENMQRWYNEDKTASLQTEFIDLLSSWGAGETSK